MSKEEIIKTIEFIRNNEISQFVSTPLNIMRFYPSLDYRALVRRAEAEIGKNLVSEELDEESITFKIIGYKHPDAGVAVSIAQQYANDEQGIYDSIKWFMRLHPQAERGEFDYIREFLTLFRLYQLDLLYTLAKLSPEDLLSSEKPQTIYESACKRRGVDLRRLTETIRERGHSEVCSAILTKVDSLLDDSAGAPVAVTATANEPEFERSPLQHAETEGDTDPVTVTKEAEPQKRFTDDKTGSASTSTASAVSYAGDDPAEALQVLQQAADREPRLKFTIAQLTRRLSFKLNFREFVARQIAPVDIIKNRFDNPNLFAMIDKFNPSNYIVFKAEILPDGKIKTWVVGDQDDFVVTNSNQDRKSLDSFGAGKIFYDNLANREVHQLKKLDEKDANGLPYAHTAFVNRTDAHEQITINLVPDMDPAKERCWLSPFSTKYEGGEEALFCLVDLKSDALRAPQALPDLDEIQHSNGKYVQYPSDGWAPQDWIIIKHDDAYNYYQNIGILGHDTDRRVVYRRLDEDGRIAAVRISPDCKTFTIEGLLIDGRPIVFEAGYMHLGVLLYVLTNDDHDELGLLPDAAKYKGKPRITVSPSLAQLACNLDQIIPLPKAKLPTEWLRKSDSGKTVWHIGSYHTLGWISRWGDEMRKNQAIEKLTGRDVVRTKGKRHKKQQQTLSPREGLLANMPPADVLATPAKTSTAGEPGEPGSERLVRDPDEFVVEDGESDGAEARGPPTGIYTWNFLLALVAPTAVLLLNGHLRMNAS
ncbi:MAG: hypothetical protein ABH875_00465, partial [Candidatus Omnitrophota bacterium]